MGYVNKVQLNIQHLLHDDEPVGRLGLEFIVQSTCRALGQTIIFNFINYFDYVCTFLRRTAILQKQYIKCEMNRVRGRWAGE